MVRRTAILALLSLLVLPAAARAAAPPNDDRADAQALKPPAKVSGTTAGATDEPNDPYACASSTGSVWYSVTGQGRRIVLGFQAGGDLDAVVTVFRAVRSQLSEVACDTSDEHGVAGLDFAAADGQRYLIRVARQSLSEPGPFTLSLRQASPPATPPGARLPARGVRRTLDRVLNTSDAWRVTMRAGRSYRVNLNTPNDACVRYGLYGPNTTDFDEESPVRFRSCRGYLVYTPRPGEGGRYTIRVLADRNFRAPEPYRLQVARTTRDDLAPGVFLGNHRRVRSSLDGLRVDVRDLYRFDVTFRSTLDLRLAARDGDDNFNLLLLSDTGKRLACSCGAFGDEELVRRLKPGRYFVAVQAVGRSRGRYVLARASRTITAAHTRWNGRSRATSAPGRAVRLGVLVPPFALGRATVTIERFDPVEGWRYHARRALRVRGGRAVTTFRPPAVGRYRARTEFAGSRNYAPSDSGWAKLLVAGPLRD
jgi:hypothetical protein